METKEKNWLVLDEKNIITGPFCKEEILDLFEQKKIKQGFHLTSNEFSWFSVQEKKHLLSLFPEIEEIEKKTKGRRTKKKSNRCRN